MPKSVQNIAGLELAFFMSHAHLDVILGHILRPDHVISSMSGCAAVLACRDAAAVALNVQGSSTKALQWAKHVLSDGSCIADAAAKCWMTMLEDAGISRSFQRMIIPT